MAAAVVLDPTDGLRGLSALLVVFGHLLTFWAPNSEDEQFPVLGLEYLSPVSLFFVISGFTLVCVYDKGPHLEMSGDASRPPVGSASGISNSAIVSVPTQDWSSQASANLKPAAPLSSSADQLTFLRRRIARLAPVYYASLILAIANLVVYEDTFSIATSVPLSLLWLQSITCLIGNEWNGPLWTASAFALLYPLFPSLLRLLRRQSVAVIYGTMVVCYITSIGIMCGWLFGLGFPGFFLHAFVGFRVPHFVIGMCAGLLAKQGASHRMLCCLTHRPTIAAELISCIFALNLIVCALLTMVGGSSLQSLYMYVVEFGAPFVQAHWLVALTDPRCGGPTHWILTRRPVRWLGEISFALYCAHWPIICWCAWAVAAKGVSAEAVPRYNFDGFRPWLFFRGWAIIPVACVCVLVAAVIHYALEVPARKSIRADRKGSGEVVVRS